MEDESGVEVYQAHVWIRRISPMIWRRLLVRSDSTIADLHYALQIVIDWSDLHLHRFHIHGQDYGISRIGGPGFSSDPRKVHLGDFKFRINKRFLYEYDFGDRWEHEVRIERRLPVEAKKIYPVCVGGRRAGPEEDCGGPWAYMERVDQHWRRLPFEDLSVMAKAVSQLLDAQDDETIRDAIGDWDELREAADCVETYQRFQPDRFDRRNVNRRLKQYATGDEEWRWG
ncbi:MAG TPA: plasmid pRiA4b ORF-3 family protein [Terriglobia bacterium]|nr:plasmid pRiA4b ORF-3 family protein [Terriglobia bacterium]